MARARGRLLQAGLWPNPEMDVSTSSDFATNREGQFTVTMGVNQALPVSGRLRLARKVMAALAEKLDAAGDNNRQAAAEAGLKQLDALLKQLKAQLPEAV